VRQALGYGAISVEFDPPVATVRFADRENGNTFRREWLDDLVIAVEAASADPEVRVVIAEGTPEVFCAGATKETLLGIANRLPVGVAAPFPRRPRRSPRCGVLGMPG
jgi:4-carboxy-3-alkylbut-2-enoyl-[acp] decarboxylase